MKALSQQVVHASKIAFENPENQVRTRMCTKIHDNVVSHLSLKVIMWFHI